MVTGRIGSPEMEPGFRTGTATIGNHHAPRPLNQSLDGVLSELLWFVAHRAGLVVLADGRFYRLLPVVWVSARRQ